MNITELQQRFNVADWSCIGKGTGGLPVLVLTGPRSQVHVYLHGTHITHWQPRGHKPVLWMSGQSWFEPGKPIRGGVPICFPWFGPHPQDTTLPAHGFARINTWTLDKVELDRDGNPQATLSLAASDATRKLWPHDFVLRFTVRAADTLQMELHLQNTGAAPLSFQEALHTYFAVSDVRNITIAGLENTEYLSKVEGGARKRQPQEPIRFLGETDRVYLNTTAACELSDPNAGRTIRVDKEGSGSTVVWNPWINKSKAMPDFGDDEWPDMVCIETCNVAENALTLAAGQSHTMKAMIAVG